MLVVRNMTPVMVTIFKIASGTEPGVEIRPIKGVWS